MPSLMSTGTQPDSHTRKIALLPWGTVIDDFLDTIGVSLESFCTEMTGGWLFGYVEAMQVAGMQVVVIIFSSGVASPLRLTHKPTGATIRVLPVTRIYRALQRTALDFHDYRVFQSKGNSPVTCRFLKRAVSLSLRKVLPYLATPLGLLARELRQGGYDTVVCQEYEDARFDLCVLLGMLSGVRVFGSFQGGVRSRGIIGRLARSLMLRASSGLIIASRTEAGRVQASYKVASNKLSQIFNPLDLRKWHMIDRDQARKSLQIPCEARVVVWHGRISIHHKGLDLLLQAWEQICCDVKGQDLRLLLIGTGQDAQIFREELERRQLPGIHWIDQYLHDRAKLQRCLSAGDVYVFPSRHEGFPVAPLEAMACGLPVVAANVQGIHDIFASGEACGGLIVPRENPAELARTVTRLLQDKAWSRDLGKRARMRVESSFSLEAVGEQLRGFLANGQRPTL